MGMPIVRFDATSWGVLRDSEIAVLDKAYPSHRELMVWVP